MARAVATNCSVTSFVHRACRLNDDSMNQQSAEFIPYILQNDEPTIGPLRPASPCSFVGVVLWGRNRFYLEVQSFSPREAMTSPQTETWIDFVPPAWLGNLDPISCHTWRQGFWIPPITLPPRQEVYSRCSNSTNLDTKGIHFSPPLCGGNGGEDWIPGD